jgi:hypothetical protein
MAKATELKTSKSSKRAHLKSESSHTKGKKARHPHLKTGAAEASNDEPKEPATDALTLKIPRCII